MLRRNFIRSIFLFIIAFIFGYTVKKEGENMVLHRADSTMLNGKEAKSISQNIKAITKKIEENELQLADNAISPDIFEGSDYEKVQKALNYAIKNNKGIRLTRMFNVTNSEPLYIEKMDDRIPVSFYGWGGGLIKDEAGFMFSTKKSFVGDIHFHFVEFRSTSGAGVKLFNGDKIIRVNTFACKYRNVDTIAIAKTKYLQSYRSVGDNIVGGKGNAYECRSVYDFSCDSVFVEHRENFFKQNYVDDTVKFRTLYGAKFRDPIIEGLTGRAFDICKTEGFLIDGGYFESNKKGNIVFASNSILEGVSIGNSRGYDSEKRTSSFIQWGGTVFNAKSFNNSVTGMPIHDTTDVLHGRISSENDRSINNENAVNTDPNRILIIKSNEEQMITDKLTGTQISIVSQNKRLRNSKDVVVKAGEYKKSSILFSEDIFSDDIISVQSVGSPSSNEYQISNYSRNSTDKKYLDVYIKNAATSSTTVTLLVTITKSDYTISG
ncbi:hypothetical protein ACIP97_03330 [Peribacillus frigoritolerans]|uniref:hypothetical protein n=1 Tax=Peribacillus frigoritolerans TaxID=450367 RepID=UPI0038249251